MSRKTTMRSVIVLALLMLVVSITPVAAQWPITCVELNDIVEAHLENNTNVGIYQRVFGDQAEHACQADHRSDVRQTFAWAVVDEVTVVEEVVVDPLIPEGYLVVPEITSPVREVRFSRQGRDSGQAINIGIGVWDIETTWRNNCNDIALQYDECRRTTFWVRLSGVDVPYGYSVPSGTELANEVLIDGRSVARYAIVDENFLFKIRAHSVSKVAEWTVTFRRVG